MSEKFVRMGCQRSPDISVIIPAYNREDVLPVTLRSLLRQTLPAAEIIVVDDGSTDGTAEVAESFGESVRVIRQENAGPAAARNRGFRESTGEFIHFFDSDDVALPNKHEVQVEALEKRGADIAYGPWIKGRFAAQGFVAENLVLQQRGLPSGPLVKALLTNWSVVPHACLFRRNIVERSGGFPEKLFGTEDQMMFLNCLLAGARVVHSPGTLELYRSDNVGKITEASSEGRLRHLRNWADFLVMAARRCDEHGIDARAWFGFRRRVWKVLQELARCEPSAVEERNELRTLAESGISSLLFQLSFLEERIRQGIEVRLGRGRAHPCFRIGKMNRTQKEEIREWVAGEKILQDDQRSKETRS